MSDLHSSADFDDLRVRLIRIAYRMLGSMADAEDIVQEAWIRWHASDRHEVREPAAFLRTVVTRLCLNELKSARRRRETYVGPWLPEPVLDPEEDRESEDITLPVMIALERLSPLERAAFLLHDVFGMSFAEVSEAIGRDPAACRKLASRARGHIDAARPRFTATREEGRKLAAAFFTASRSGDMTALKALLSEDIAVYADGGGKVPTTAAPTFGLDAAMDLFGSLGRYFTGYPSTLVRYGTIDGLPAFVTIEGNDILQTTALDIRAGKITTVYVTRNPQKLKHIAPLLRG